jgi:hypothetical protein
MDCGEAGMRGYEKGQRVTMTVFGYAHLIKPWMRRASARVTIGTVVRRHIHCIVVRRDGTKTPRTYRHDFWELAQ